MLVGYVTRIKSNKIDHKNTANIHKNNSRVQLIVIIFFYLHGLYSRFIMCDSEDGLYEDMSLDEFDPHTEAKKEERKKEKQEEMLKQIDFKK